MSESDFEAVARLLGRTPRGQFNVVVRREDGQPMVIENFPLLDDGTPMPTLYWLCDPDLVHRISQLESNGGVKAAEADLDFNDIQRSHDIYQARRDAMIPDDWDGPRPSGGVGGTRRGIKCLHTHYAWYLINPDDPVGQWVNDRLLDDPDPGNTVQTEHPDSE